MQKNRLQNEKNNVSGFFLYNMHKKMLKILYIKGKSPQKTSKKLRFYNSKIKRFKEKNGVKR